MTVDFAGGEQRCFDPGYVTALRKTKDSSATKKPQAIVGAEVRAEPAPLAC